MLNKKNAIDLMDEMISNPSLRRHSISVGMVMEAYANKLGENAEEWAIAGILHDADYEQYPDEHPNIIVKKLQGMGEEKIAHAISAHHTRWGKSYNTRLDKALIACDELTGFIVAVALVRPTRLDGLSVKSVKKKLKTKYFAAGVERSEVYKGLELFAVELNEHIQFIIEVLQQNAEELALT